MSPKKEPEGSRDRTTGHIRTRRKHAAAPFPRSSLLSVLRMEGSRNLSLSLVPAIDWWQITTN